MWFVNFFKLSQTSNKFPHIFNEEHLCISGPVLLRPVLFQGNCTFFAAERFFRTSSFSPAGIVIAQGVFPSLFSAPNRSPEIPAADHPSEDHQPFLLKKLKNC